MAATPATPATPAPAKRKADDISNDIVEEAVAAATASTEEFADKESRRFFPRVKHLLSPEYQPFLAGLLDALEETGAPKSANASHKVDNEWYKAFYAVYSGVASECSQPQGKNRFHKFKDKILEIYQAIEDYTDGDLPLRGRALSQLDEYRRACQNAAATPKKSDEANKLLTPKKFNHRGKAGVKPPNYTPWNHFDEKAAMACLPEELQKLIHFRNLATELGCGASRVPLEDKHDAVLAEYLKDIPTDEDGLYKMSQGLAFLARYSHAGKEKREISDVFENVLKNYLDIVAPPAATESASV